jgi:hypothetical protein
LNLSPFSHVAGYGVYFSSFAAGDIANASAALIIVSASVVLVALVKAVFALTFATRLG